jgi:hypothetical protein
MTSGDASALTAAWRSASVVIAFMGARADGNGEKCAPSGVA